MQMGRKGRVMRFDGRGAEAQDGKVRLSHIDQPVGPDLCRVPAQHGDRIDHMLKRVGVAEHVEEPFGDRRFELIGGQHRDPAPDAVGAGVVGPVHAQGHGGAGLQGLMHEDGVGAADIGQRQAPDRHAAQGREFLGMAAVIVLVGRLDVPLPVFPGLDRAIIGGDFRQVGHPGPEDVPAIPADQKGPVVLHVERGGFGARADGAGGHDVVRSFALSLCNGFDAAVDACAIVAPSTISLPEKGPVRTDFVPFSRNSTFDT